jgi:hypothetical protein
MSAPQLGEALHKDGLADWSPVFPCRPLHAEARSGCVGALRHCGPAHGCGPCQPGLRPLLARGSGLRYALCTLGRAGMPPSGRDSNETPFHFHFGLNSSLNFEISYLFEYVSKIHETGSVGFVILISI